MNGYTNPDERLIVIDHRLSVAHAAKTMLHEAAQIHLGHTDDIAEYTQHRGLMETEAESVAYIVAGLHGIGYIAGWSGADTERIKDTAARVLHTAHAMSDMLVPTLEAPEA